MMMLSSMSCPSTSGSSIPRAPQRRPTAAPLEPPSLALPPSPPVDSPFLVQLAAAATVAAAAAAAAATANSSNPIATSSSSAAAAGMSSRAKQQYSRSLSFFPHLADCLSTSAPGNDNNFPFTSSTDTNNRSSGLAKGLDSRAVAANANTNARTSAFQTPSTENDEDVEVEDGEFGRLGRKLSDDGMQQASSNADMLSRSPTIFSILSSSQRSPATMFGSISNLPQQPPSQMQPRPLFSDSTPSTSVSAQSLTSPIKPSSRAAVASPTASTAPLSAASSLTTHTTPSSTSTASSSSTSSSSSSSSQGRRRTSQNRSDNEADLLFSLSLTDESLLDDAADDNENEEDVDVYGASAAAPFDVPHARQHRLSAKLNKKPLQRHQWQ